MPLPASTLYVNCSSVKAGYELGTFSQLDKFQAQFFL